MGSRVWDLVIGSIVFTFLGLSSATAASKCVLALEDMVPTKLSQAAFEKLKAAKPREIVALYVRLKVTADQPEVKYVEIMGTARMWAELLKDENVARVIARLPAGATEIEHQVEGVQSGSDRIHGGLPAPEGQAFGASSTVRPSYPRSESFTTPAASSNVDALIDPGFH